MSPAAFQATLTALHARLPGPAGERWVAALEQGALTIELYAPRGTDPQAPHTRDEVYVVVSGTGTLAAGDARFVCAPGDVLYVPAGTPHRFEDFSDDLAAWGIFFPAVA